MHIKFNVSEIINCYCGHPTFVTLGSPDFLKCLWQKVAKSGKYYQKFAMFLPRHFLALCPFESSMPVKMDKVWLKHE